MAAARKREKQANHRQRARRRTKKMAAAAGAMLLIPSVVASEPALSKTMDNAALDGVGNGLMGLTDPDSVNADGTLTQDDQIGADLLRDAGNPQQLGLEGLDLPSGPLGIPGVMLDAYKKAEALLAKQQPNCHLSWSLLASIARIESGHARGGQVFGNGDTINPILGPVLNGGGFAAIEDTDAGRLDGDARWDRAVGPFQFIPSTWAQYASDGNGDHISNPHNVFDAAVAAGSYLCSGGMDLANPQQRAAAVFRYNHSDTYVRVVLIWADAYLNNVTPIPSTPVPAVTPFVQAVAAPVDPTAPPTTTPSETPSTTPSTTPTTTSSTTTTTTTTTPTCSTSTTSPPSSTTSPTTTPPPNCQTTTTTPPANGGGETSSSTTTPTTTSQAPAETSSSTNSGAGEGSTTSSSTVSSSSVAPSSSSAVESSETTTSPAGQ